MSAIAGRVLILPKGDYDASVTYEFLDLVNHNSSSWLAKKASQGVEPSDANSEFWQKFGSSVTPDGVTIVIDENGVISAVGGTADKVTYENESVADVTNVKEALDVIFDGGAIGEDYATKTEVGYPSYTPQETVNLLNPTMATTTAYGVTCTNNGDGTYTLNGTSTQESQFNLIVNTPITFKAGVTYRIVGCPVGGGWLSTYWVYAQDNNYVDIGDGVNFTYDTDKSATVRIGFGNGITFDNLTFKPMITTNLNATIDDFVPYGVTASNAGYHNSVYRGKYLGDHVTDEQYEAISNGSFDDLFIGDYWTIDGVNWRIAAFDYYLNSGDTAFVQHHAVIVPDAPLYTHAMNGGSTDATTGAYVGSKLYTEGLEQAKNTINTIFNGRVLAHRVYLNNAVTSGHVSGGAWFDSEVDLMNEQMVYGGSIFLPMANGSVVYTNQRIEKSQLPLFAHRHDMISNGAAYWLRDVVSASHFAFVHLHGYAAYNGATNSLGVRPSFCIG